MEHQPRARRRLWTLRDLDREQVWTLWWNAEALRWDVTPALADLTPEHSS